MINRFRQTSQPIFAWKSFFTGAFFLVTFSVHARDKQAQIDSLNHLIETTGNDTVRVNAYMELDNLIYLSDPLLDEQINRTVARLCAQRSAAPAVLSGHERYFYKKWQGAALNNLGAIFRSRGDLDSSLYYNKESLKLKMEIGDNKGIANSYQNIGSVYHLRGDLVKALEHYQWCLKIRESLKDEKGIAGIYINIGAVYHYQDDFTNAIRYYEMSLEGRIKQQDSAGISGAYTNLGTVYSEQGDSALKAGNAGLSETLYAKALASYQGALEIDLLLDSKNATARDENNIGTIYLKMKKYDAALECFNRCIQIRNEINVKSGLAVTYYSMATIYLETGDYNKAVQYGEMSYAFAKQTNSIIELNGATSVLYKTFRKQNKFEKALGMYEEYIASKDSISNKEQSTKTMQLIVQYEYDKKAAADSLVNAKKDEMNALVLTKKNAELDAKRNEQIVLYGGVFVLILFGGFTYNRFKVTSRQKHIIEQQKEIVEEKQKEILDSINYAKRIQNAILPPKRMVEENLGEHFILYAPKDIVAGDFYWLELKNGKVLFAAADCTGHGVPGAMVSVVCNNGLNRSVREHDITEPGKILDKTRQIVIQEFEKSDDEVNDGMDISLCALDLKTKTMQWAGANNPLWHLRNGVLTEYKPNKQPIGKLYDPVPFTTHTIPVETGDVIYIFTDGFQDQFGGEKGKKFKASQLKELLLRYSDQPMPELKNILINAFEEWKGPLEQVDDVCVIGLRI
jgi:serine phosphatase RsbU (regulator of sigma subunit)